MVDNADNQVDRLIGQLRQAQKARRAARNWMTALVAVIVLVFILLGVNAVKSFQKDEIDDFGIALGEEAADLTPLLLEEVNAAANRLLPAYEKAFIDEFTESQMAYVGVLQDEYVLLDQYAQQQWPKIEEGIAKFVVAQEDTAREALSQYVPEDKLVDLSEEYATAMQTYMEHFFEEHYTDKVIVAENIMEKLHQIAENEPDLPPENSQYVIGMLLELLGLEMQANAEENS